MESVTIPCEFKRETEKALLIVDQRTGEEVWLPLSQVDKITRKPDGTGEVRISQWIAAEKDLLG